MHATSSHSARILGSLFTQARAAQTLTILTIPVDFVYADKLVMTGQKFLPLFNLGELNTTGKQNRQSTPLRQLHAYLIRRNCSHYNQCQRRIHRCTPNSMQLVQGSSDDCFPPRLPHRTVVQDDWQRLQNKIGEGTSTSHHDSLYETGRTYKLVCAGAPSFFRSAEK